ncbi:hypothetical protein BC941DRAFT_411364 [Chlamydoabsidia padenii]|nr:hypothetical protein BC941DRAFT_411364 [Chlamydoabsidia padenii]
MLGNRFHDAGTPPPLNLPGLGRLGGDDTPSILSVANEVDEDNFYANSSIPNTVFPTSAEKTLGDDDTTLSAAPEHRRPSHTDQAIELVESVTGSNKYKKKRRRRTTRPSVLASLLKLEGASGRFSSEPSEQQEGQDLAEKKTFTTRPPFVKHHSARPLQQLRSIASSRALLQSLGRSTQSARNSGYFDDMDKAELGDYDLNSVAQRMKITAEIADILERQDFIIKLGKNLVRTGAPTHRIEAAMEKTSKKLEIDGSYFVLPGLIMVSFGDVETHTSETHLIKCSKSLDISKLALVNEIAHQVAKGQICITDASKQLDDIKNSPPTWNVWMTLVGYTISSAFIAPLFFGGSWTDCWVSALFGLGVGIATYISERIPMFGNVFEMAVTIVVSIITLALNNYVCYSAVALSAVVVALPGYALTSAVMELSAKNLCSGTVHLIHAIMYILFLAFGMGYGSTVWSLTHPGTAIRSMDTCHNPVDPYWYFLILPMTTLGISICFGANIRQYPAFTLNAAVGFVVYYFMSKVVGPTSVITSSVGAFALGLTGNIYGRVTKRLAFVPLIGGIIILVPGSLGVRGAVTLFEDGSENANGMFAFQIIGIALSITLGLFLANLCVYPSGRKRSVFLGF